MKSCFKLIFNKSYFAEMTPMFFLLAGIRFEYCGHLLIVFFPFSIASGFLLLNYNATTKATQKVLKGISCFPQR